MKIGITFGGYCPMHRGHLDCIMKAKKDNDKCFVVVCGYDGEDRAEEIGLDLNRRVALVKEFFRNDEQIIVLRINDTELGIDESMSDENWKIWTDAVQKQIINQIGVNFDFTYYVAESFYYEKLTTLLNIKTELISKTIPISGTKIRKNPIKYWNYIIPTYRPFLTKNILIIGTASEGKTTLVNDIHKYYGIPYTTEFGRDYMEERNIKDTDLTFTDFVEFLIGQRNYIQQAIEYPANTGVTIHDTDNLVTLMYAKAYINDKDVNINKKDYEQLKSLAISLQHNIKWDKIYIIKPQSKFVDDGIRYMKQSTMDERESNFNILMELVKDFNLMDKVEFIENGPNEYYKNFRQVCDYIDKFYE